MISPWLLLVLLQVLPVSIFAGPIEVTKAVSVPKPTPIPISNNYTAPQLYVFGGYHNGTFLSSASAFNSSTSRWTPINDLSVPRVHFCGAVVGTKIYLFGGGTEDGEILRTAEVYDCETGTYSQYRSMPSPRQECAAAVLGNFVYISGGWDGSNGSLSSVIRYNIHTTRQEPVTPMLRERQSHQLVELSGRLYAIGSWGTKTVESYNPETNQWKGMASTMFEHKYFGATVHQGKIYVHSDAGFEVFDPIADHWKVLKTQLSSLLGRTLVSMEKWLYAIGGGITGDNAATKSVFFYATHVEVWNQLSEMDVPRMYHTSFVVNH